MVLQLPLRIESRLAGGVVHMRTVTRKVRRNGKRRVVRRRVTVYRAGTRSRLGRKVRIGGGAHQPRRQPLAGAQIHVYSTPQGGVEQLAGVIQTDARGRYALHAARGRQPHAPARLPRDRPDPPL
jgi:hypothetical protein